MLYEVITANGHVEIVNILLRERADVNAKNWLGETALSWAAVKGHVEIVKTLLAHGANPNIIDKHGWTALMYAAREGHLSVLQSYNFV